jgi:hypothetical protein
MICAEARAGQFNEGQKVEARYGGKHQWYGGTIAAGNDDGTYEVKYDDGDSEPRVKFIRALLTEGVVKIDEEKESIIAENNTPQELHATAKSSVLLENENEESNKEKKNDEVFHSNSEPASQKENDERKKSSTPIQKKPSLTQAQQNKMDRSLFAAIVAGNLTRARDLIIDQGANVNVRHGVTTNYSKITFSFF